MEVMGRDERWRINLRVWLDYDIRVECRARLFVLFNLEVVVRVVSWINHEGAAEGAQHSSLYLSRAPPLPQ